MRDSASAGWDIGSRPNIPMPYIKLPNYKFVHAHARHEDGTYSSRPNHLRNMARERREEHRRPSQGWPSKFHPRVLDYRTVDELGLPIDELEDLERRRKPKETPPKLVFIDGSKLHKDGELGMQ